MKRWVLAIAVALGALAAVPAVQAHDGRGGGPTSVFPVPRDPWRSWGVRHELPKHVGPPRLERRVVVESAPVWVPGQWVWNGATWVWWPGYWVR